MFSRLLDIIPACDGQTDRRTPHDGKDRAMQNLARVKFLLKLPGFGSPSGSAQKSNDLLLVKHSTAHKIS